MSCAHDDVDYHGDCSQVKGGVVTACSHEPGRPPRVISCALISQHTHFSSLAVSVDSTRLSCHEVMYELVKLKCTRWRVPELSG